MAYVISYGPTSDQIFTAIRAVLLKMVIAGTEVIQAQVNRVPETNAADFVLMTPIETPRLGTNYDTDIDCAFTASIAGNLMTVTAVNPLFPGKIGNGNTVFGPDVADGTVVVTQQSGTPGGIGVYQLSGNQNVGSETMAAGTQELLQPTGLAVQFDVHGENSWNNANIITTIFRDERGVDLFLEQGKVVVPLYCDDPKQKPFVNENDQLEDRFIITARFEADQKVVVAQEFADRVDVTFVDVTNFTL